MPFNAGPSRSFLLPFHRKKSMRSAFKGSDSGIEFQHCSGYDEDHDYVCYDCNLVKKGVVASELGDKNAWIANALEAMDHLRSHIGNGDVVPNRLVGDLQEDVKRRMFVHQSLMSPTRRFDGSHSSERENAFHKEWWMENESRFGKSISTLLFNSWGITSPTTREVAIVASLITWLGTNVGFCFVERALKRCGYKIIKDTTTSKETI